MLLQLADKGRVPLGTIDLRIVVLVFLCRAQHHATAIACAIQVLACLRVELSEPRMLFDLLKEQALCRIRAKYVLEEFD